MNIDTATASSSLGPGVGFGTPLEIEEIPYRDGHRNGNGLRYGFGQRLRFGQWLWKRFGIGKWVRLRFRKRFRFGKWFG